jgi:flagellin
MNAQVRGMNVAQRNANDAISMSQTGESDRSARSATCCSGCANWPSSRPTPRTAQSDRDALQDEFTELQEEITRTADTTRFNGQSVLTTSTSFDFQIGANATTDDQVSITGVNITGTATSTGSNDGSLSHRQCRHRHRRSRRSAPAGRPAAGADFGAYSAGTAGTGALGAIEHDRLRDLAQVNTARSSFGAAQNRFENVISNLQVATENQSAARSRIMDADFASETATLSRAQVLQQAGVAMLSQANAIPNNVLALLR